MNFNTIIQEVGQVSNFVIDALIRVWPLLIISIPLSVFIREINVSSKINKVLNKNIYAAILIATIIGAVAPFCSCSVIPVISSLLIAGVPIGPVMAFWLASPSMDPEIFFLSVASVGWNMAIARIVATFIMSFLGGIITHWILKRWKTQGNLLKMEKKEQGCGESCQACDTSKNLSVNERRLLKLKEIAVDSGKSILFILKFLIIAFFLEALILFYLPSEWVLAVFGESKIGSILMGTAIGVPLYTTNMSALGMVSGLLDKGLTGGAGLAFLISGATTTIPAMSAVYNLVHKKVFMIYIGLTVFWAIAAGLIYESFLSVIG